MCLRQLGAAVLVVLILCWSAGPQRASGCAAAPPKNKPVRIADESAIILIPCLVRHLLLKPAHGV